MEEQKIHVREIAERMENCEKLQLILCNMQGSGKTLTCLAAAKRDIEGDKSKKILVVAPPSAIQSWTVDASIHFDPPIRNVVLNSASTKNNFFFSLVPDCQLIILSYNTLCSAHKSAVQWRTAILKGEINKLEALYPKDANTKHMNRDTEQQYTRVRETIRSLNSFLHNHKTSENMSIEIPFAELNEKEKDRSLRPMLFDNLYMMKFRWLFADEAHEARNKKSDKFSSLQFLRREHSVAVSATICNNSAEDYISILKIVGVNPEQGWSVLRRNKEACSRFMNECSKKMIIVSSKKVRDAMQANYFPKSILLRPTGFKHVEEIERYDRARSEWTNSSCSRNDDNILRVITALRQCCDFATTEDQTKGVMVKLKDGVVRRIVSTKLELVVQYVQTCVIPRGEKVLIFAWFKDTIEVLKAMMPRRLKVETITGSVTHENRKKILASIRAYRGSAALIVTPGTMSLGANIECANHCILVNNWWNPVVSMQALWRIGRPGQRLSIRWLSAMIPNTVEDSIKLVADFKVELKDRMILGNITSPMLDGITSNKAIARASKTKKTGIPSNLLRPIVNQNTDAIIQMRHSFYQTTDTVGPEAGCSSFLSPCIGQAEALIQSDYDYIVRDEEDLAQIPPSHPIDLSHVPQTREKSDGVPPGLQAINKFAEIRKRDDAERQDTAIQMRKELPADERGLLRFLSPKEAAARREKAKGKRKRTVKILSIEQSCAFERCDPKRQKTIAPSSSITTSIQRLRSISSFCVSNN